VLSLTNGRNADGATHAPDRTLVGDVTVARHERHGSRRVHPLWYACAPMQRRVLLSLSLAFLGVSARAQQVPDPEAADAFIRRTGTELADAVAGASTAAERRKRLAVFLERVVDMDEVARFCLGRFWTVATAEQRTEYLRLFRAGLVNGVAERLGNQMAGDVRVITSRPQLRDGGMSVPTTIERAGNKPNHVTWLVTSAGGRLKIIDVIAEGVSLRVTLRSDYVSFLNRYNGDVGVLLQTMAAQVARTS